jgi:hypothetical protein
MILPKKVELKVESLQGGRYGGALGHFGYVAMAGEFGFGFY